MKNLLQLLVLIFWLLLSGCNNNTSVPLPVDRSVQPVTRALHFSKPEPLQLTDTTKVSVTTTKLNFNQLPEEVFDSTVAQPFAGQPEVKPFSLDSLPTKHFDFNKIPSQPLKYETILLGKPRVLDVELQPAKQISGDAIYKLRCNELSDDDYLCIKKDARGFIWLLTTSGLYRYDGNKLVQFYHGDIPPGFIKSIEDDKGRLWFQTLNNGIYVFDIQNNLLDYIPQAMLHCKRNFSLVTDAGKRIWSSSDSGLHIIDEDLGAMKTITTAQGLTTNATYMQVTGENNNIWGTSKDQDIIIINTKDQTIKDIDSTERPHSAFVFNMLEDAHKNIWMFNNNGSADIINITKGTESYFSNELLNISNGDSFAFATAVLDDNTGNIWASYLLENKHARPTRPLKIINLQTKTIRTVFIPIPSIQKPYSPNVTAETEDKYGQVWLNAFGGLYMMKKRGCTIHQAGTGNLTSTTEDNSKNICVATFHKGLRILNPATGKAKILDKSNGLSNDSLEDVHQINGKIYTVTFSGLDIIDSLYQNIEHIKIPVGVSTLLYQHAIWSSNRAVKGITIVDPEKKIKVTALLPGLPTDTSVGRIQSDNRGNIWFTTYGGKAGIINGHNLLVRYIDSKIIPDKNGGGPIVVDHAGNTWMGLHTALYRIDKQQDSVTIFTTSQGLINRKIMSLVEHRGSIYAGTLGGINIITPPDQSPNKKWVVQSIGQNFGIIKTFGGYNSECIADNGTYFWTGNGGLTSIKNTAVNDATPSTFITGLNVFGKPAYFSKSSTAFTVVPDTLWSESKDTFYLKGQRVHLAAGDEQKWKWDSISGPYNMPVNLTLPYDENYLQFHFYQSNLGVEDIVGYKYILEGVDKNWSEKTSNKFSQIYYTLSPGSYTFKVSSLYNNEWSKPVKFSFTISPPWWKTWWAYSLYVICLIAAIWAFIDYRSRNLKKQKKILEERVARRTKQLSEKTTELNKSLEDLKSTQSQLIQQEKMASLGELTAGIAHEIQNPLNFVNNFSEVNKEMIDELQTELKSGNMEEAIEYQMT